MPVTLLNEENKWKIVEEMQEIWLAAFRGVSWLPSLWSAELAQEMLSSHLSFLDQLEDRRSWDPMGLFKVSMPRWDSQCSLLNIKTMWFLLGDPFSHCASECINRAQGHWTCSLILSPTTLQCTTTYTETRHLYCVVRGAIKLWAIQSPSCRMPLVLSCL